MKYANIVFGGNRKGSYNLGDDLQLVVIDYLYSRMGISNDDIIHIGLADLSTYDGEYCILPISFPLYGYREGTYITMFSPKIVPVFLALSIMSESISEEECDYLKRFEPIGCRDFHTVKIMRKNGILAYLNGCMSVTLPRRDNLIGNRVYLVDIPKEYYTFIPDGLRKDAVITSQVVDDCLDPRQEVIDRLNEYADNASLIITTRLHCAMPCIAMGLPVVMMKNRYSFRFPFISRYIHIYERDEFESIDWSPKPIYYEKKKEEIINLAINRLKQAYNEYSAIFDLSWFYEQDNIREDYYIEHFDNVREYIEDHFSEDDSFNYAIWGITQKADMICSYIEDNYPNAVFVYAYDRKKETEFHGLVSGNDVGKLCEEGVFVFVTAATANLAAIELFSSIGKDNYHISDDGIERIGRR